MTVVPDYRQRCIGSELCEWRRVSTIEMLNFGGLLFSDTQKKRRTASFQEIAIREYVEIRTVRMF